MSGNACGIPTALLIDRTFVWRAFEVSVRSPHDQAAGLILIIGGIAPTDTPSLLTERPDFDNRGPKV